RALRPHRNPAYHHPKRFDAVCWVVAVAPTDPHQVRYAQLSGELVPREWYRLWARTAARSQYFTGHTAQLPHRIDARPRPAQVWLRGRLRARRSRICQQRGRDVVDDPAARARPAVFGNTGRDARGYAGARHSTRPTTGHHQPGSVLGAHRLTADR